MAAADGRRLRLLLQLGPEYQGFTPGAAWEKTETGLRSLSVLRLVDGYALGSKAQPPGAAKAVPATTPAT